MLNLLTGPRPSNGLFYGLLCAIRVTNVVLAGAMHIITGTNWALSAEMLDKHSPAQGRAQTLSVCTHLKHENMVTWLDTLLTEDAMVAVRKSRDLYELRGRPLFLSSIWSVLKGAASAGRVESTEEVVSEALKACVKDAAIGARARVSALWTKLQDPRAVPAAGDLLRYLFHSSVMCGGWSKGVGRWSDEVKEAIVLGILNADPDERDLDLSVEPITLEAIRETGVEKVRDHGRDGVMEMLSRRMSAPQNEVADQGPAQEDCMGWWFMLPFLRGEEVVSLRAYFEGLHASTDATGGEGTYALLPEDLDQWVVTLEKGVRCDGGEWEHRCPLELLERDPHLFLHHTRTSMAGFDWAFSAMHKHEVGVSRRVLLSGKNRLTGSLADAARSIDIGTWYPDRVIDRVRVEHQGRDHLRSLLRSNPSLSNAIRVIICARPVSSQVLCDVAFLNRTTLKDHPLYILRPRPVDLGVNIFPEGRAPEYSVTRNWPLDVFPTPVPGLDAEGAPDLPRPPPLWKATSCTVRLEATRSDIAWEHVRTALGESAPRDEPQPWQRRGRKPAWTIMYEEFSAPLHIMTTLATSTIFTGTFSNPPVMPPGRDGGGGRGDQGGGGGRRRRGRGGRGRGGRGRGGGLAERGGVGQRQSTASLPGGGEVASAAPRGGEGERSSKGDK